MYLHYIYIYIYIHIYIFFTSNIYLKNTISTYFFLANDRHPCGGRFSVEAALLGPSTDDDGDVSRGENIPLIVHFEYTQNVLFLKTGTHAHTVHNSPQIQSEPFCLLWRNNAFFHKTAETSDFSLDFHMSCITHIVNTSYESSRVVNLWIVDGTNQNNEMSSIFNTSCVT
jgi:hypothetical protein